MAAFRNRKLSTFIPGPDGWRARTFPSRDVLLYANARYVPGPTQRKLTFCLPNVRDRLTPPLAAKLRSLLNIGPMCRLSTMPYSSASWSSPLPSSVPITVALLMPPALSPLPDGPSCLVA